MLASERLQLGEAGRAVTFNASGGVVPEAYACMLPLGDTAFITQGEQDIGTPDARWRNGNPNGMPFE